MKLRKVSEQVVVEDAQISPENYANLSDDESSSKKISTGQAVSRRTFLRNSGLMAGGATVVSSGFGLGMMKKAEAKEVEKGATTLAKTICTHCSVGQC